MSLLENINIPQDLKRLKSSDLPQVCDELRQFIVDVVSTKGGHFGASLGVVRQLLYIIFSTRPTTNWFGTLGIRPTDIKS